MQKGRKLWEKVLSIVLAVVCCVGIVNLSPLAEEAKAANTNIYFYAIDGCTYNGVWAWDSNSNDLQSERQQGKKNANGFYVYDVNQSCYFNLQVNGSTTSGTFSISDGASQYYTWTSEWGFRAYNSEAEILSALGVSSNVTFTVKDATSTSWINNGDDLGYTAVLRLVDTDTNTSYAMTNVDDNTWTVSIPTTVTNISIYRDSSQGSNWNSWTGLSRGDNTTYYITGSGTGQWTDPSGSSSNITFTIKDCTSDGWLDKDSCVMWIYVAEGQDYKCSLASDNVTWTVSIPASVSSFYVQRRSADAATTHNSWTVSDRGSNTVYYITSDGAGQWTEPSGSETGNGVSTGTPLSGATYSVTPGEFKDQTDKNGTVDKFVMAGAVIYDYFNNTQINAANSGSYSENLDISHMAFDKGSIESSLTDEGAWKAQFQTFNASLVTNYQTSDPKLLTYPLYTGGYDSINDWTNWTTYVPLSYIYSRMGSSYIPTDKEWRLNHGIEGNGDSVVQGITNKYLSTNGDLLTSEQNTNGTYAVLPQFDADYLTKNNLGAVYGSVENPIAFPFRESSSKAGYYVFDSLSGLDNVYLVADSSAASGYSLEYNSSAGAQIKDNNNAVGYFPLDNAGESYNNNRNSLNYGIGTRIDIPFTVPNKAGATAPSYNYQEKTATRQDNTESYTTFDLSSIGTGTKYIVINAKDTNVDYITVNGTNYNMNTSGIVLGGSAYYHNNGATQEDHGAGLSKIACFSGYKGYIIIPVEGANASSVTVAYRCFNDNVKMSVAATDSLTEAQAAGEALINYRAATDDVKFSFTGDDDLWVYIDGVLVLDMGGAHAKASGNINFTSGVATVEDVTSADSGAGLGAVNVTLSDLGLDFSSSTTQHTMSVFYMERGLYESNLKVEFNFEVITQKNGLTVSNTVDLTTINDGFKTGLTPDDFTFTYDVYDMTYYTNNLSSLGDTEAKSLLYDKGILYLTGNSSKTATLEQEMGDDPNATIAGDQMKVTQGRFGGDDIFDTSWVLTDTNGGTIKSYADVNNGNPYNVVDGTLDSQGGTSIDLVNPTQDNFFKLADADGTYTNEELHLTAAFTNTARVNTITIQKDDTSVAHEASDTYTFTVSYSQLLGIAKSESAFTGTYTVVDKATGNVKRAGTAPASGEITISADEKIVIEGVPVKSTIKVSEKDTGNYLMTTITDNNLNVLFEGENNTYSFTTGTDTAIVYNWTVTNGDKNAVYYFAEVGSPIKINSDAGLELKSGSETGTVYYTENTPASGGFTIREAPDASGSTSGGTDAVITNVSIGDGEVAVGDKIYFDITVKNIGDTAISSGTKVGLRIRINDNDSTILWCDKLTTGLAPGEEKTVRCNGQYGYDSNAVSDGVAYWTAVDGSTNFTAAIESGSDSATGNNEYKFTLTVPYVKESSEQKSATVTYSYHEEVTAVGPVSSTKGTPVKTSDSEITYTYPADAAAGSDIFYYEVSKIADADVSVGGNTVIRAGEAISTTTIPAVVYAYQVNNDVYVLDYGLGVNLAEAPNSIFANDTVSIAGASTTLSKYGFVGTAGALATSVDGIAKGEYDSSAIGYVASGSTAYAALTSDYSYNLNKFLDGVDTFVYGVQVKKDGATGTLNASNATPVMNAQVTVVPASVVYYEDNFSYSTETGTTTAITYTGEGVVVNNTGLNVTQSNDVESLYGFDEAYADMTGDSNGSTVLAKGQKVSFTFKGTGFDIVARTADTASVLYVVSSGSSVVKMGLVDTYYNNGTLYQLPVISVKDLAYGEYTVTFMIASSSNYSSFYFDGIRIYNPLSSDAEAQQYYNSNEYGAAVQTVRSLILGDCTFTGTTITKPDNTVVEVNGEISGSKITVIDSEGKAGNIITEDLKGVSSKSTTSLSEMLSVGPNNEVYLGTGSALAFYVIPDANVDEADRTLQVEVKAVNTASAGSSDIGAGLTLSTSVGDIASIKTSTAMYYNIPLDKCVNTGVGSYLVILNGASLNGYNLSFTNLKVKGYELIPYEITSGGSTDATYINSITVNGSGAVTFERKTEVEFVIALNKTGIVNKDNLALTANGKDVTIREIKGNDDGTYTVKTLAPNAVGTFTYYFSYTDEAGNVSATSVAAKVTAGKSSR